LCGGAGGVKGAGAPRLGTRIFLFGLSGNPPAVNEREIL